MEKSKHSHTTGDNVKQYSHFDKQSGSSQNSKDLTISPRNSTPSFISKSNKNISTQNLVHSSIIYNARKWEQPKDPSADEWVNKPWQIHTTE